MRLRDTQQKIINGALDYAREFAMRNPRARNFLRSVISDFSGAIALREFEAARQRRNNLDWNPWTTDANSEMRWKYGDIVNRSQNLYYNNGLATKAIETYVTNVVGTGITPKAKTGDPDTDSHIDRQFARWAQVACGDGVSVGFAAAQEIAVRGWLVRGMCFARKRRRMAADGLPVPMQVQLLESDMLATQKNETLSGGGRIDLGIELDALDRIAAYHFYKTHPGASYIGSGVYSETSRVPRDEVAHLYTMQRPGQRVGIPLLLPVMNALRDLDDLNDAELLRKKIDTSLAMIVTGEDAGINDLPEDVSANYGLMQDSSGNPVKHIRPGMIAYLRGDKNISMHVPQASGGLEDFQRNQIMLVATGLLMTYELLSGDLSRVNYSSIRAGLIQYHRVVKALQKLRFIPMFVQPVTRWWVEEAQLWDKRIFKALDEYGEINFEYTPPRLEVVDRQKEALADLIELKIHTRSLAEIIREKGGDPEDVIKEIAATNTMLDELNLKPEWDLRADYLTDTDGNDKDNKAKREALDAIASGDTARMKRVLESM